MAKEAEAKDSRINREVLDLSQKCATLSENIDQLRNENGTLSSELLKQSEAKITSLDKESCEKSDINKDLQNQMDEAKETCAGMSKKIDELEAENAVLLTDGQKKFQKIKELFNEIGKLNEESTKKSDLVKDLRAEIDTQTTQSFNRSIEIMNLKTAREVKESNYQALTKQFDNVVVAMASVEEKLKQFECQRQGLESELNAKLKRIEESRNLLSDDKRSLIQEIDEQMQRWGNNIFKYYNTCQSML